MATILWPTTGRAFTQITYDESFEQDIQQVRARSGRITTRELPGGRWYATIGVPPESVARLAERQQMEALVLRIMRGSNLLSMFNPTKQSPLGGLTGSPTVASTVAVGATTAALTGCNGGVLRGDLLAINGMRVMITADATPVSTNMTVEFEGTPHRFGASVGAVVTTVRPRTLYIVDERRIPFSAQRGDVLEGFSIPLVETWA